MTREERIEQESKKQRTVSEEIAFQKGAKWADDNPAWISVEDKLPEEENYYLVSDGISVLRYWVDRGWVPSGLSDDITHWMPLPNPPKKGE